MELNFIKCGDYYIPDIKVKNPNIRLGKWGRMRKEYLRLANPVLFSDMVLNETLYEHCAEIEETAKKRMEIIVPQLAKAYGVTEQLKAENQIEWVRQMNACVAQAEEAIKGELMLHPNMLTERLSGTPLKKSKSNGTPSLQGGLLPLCPEKSRWSYYRRWSKNTARSILFLRECVVISQSMTPTHRDTIRTVISC